MLFLWLSCPFLAIMNHDSWLSDYSQDTSRLTVMSKHCGPKIWELAHWHLHWNKLNHMRIQNTLVTFKRDIALQKSMAKCPSEEKCALIHFRLAKLGSLAARVQNRKGWGSTWFNCCLSQGGWLKENCLRDFCWKHLKTCARCLCKDLTETRLLLRLLKSRGWSVQRVHHHKFWTFSTLFCHRWLAEKKATWETIKYQETLSSETLRQLVLLMTFDMARPKFNDTS